ncbi:terminase [Rhodoferax sp. TH121]|uniref:PBSX family phage terminase large subunit n=1 Tax=Rhodoferax sp. TH121 TaxID=2022803 RepID=UPI000B96FFDF|nr:PBSX family phage terminase large subunit [Rhodoferax sp. TH121]OYQ41087.1 terminase [Rhodoferax sp. TH121]
MASQLKTTLNPCLRDFWKAPARNRVLYGGRASSKSWDAAGFATFLADNYKLRILCVRQFQNRISESVYALLKIQIERFGLGHRFDIQRDKIYNTGTDTEFMFYGLWRSIDEIKSLESVDVLWIEEAHNLTEEQWKVLEPTIRKDHSQVWIIFNPKLATDFAYKRFVLNPPPDTIVRRINYDENPFLSGTMLKIIEAAKKEDPDEFAHIYGGEPMQDDDGVIIKRSWLLAAIDAHKALGFTAEGRKRTGFDIADSGQDKCATVYAHGSVALGADMWKAAEDELLKSCTRVYHAARAVGSDITYDSIGVGASAGAKFGEINQALTGSLPVRYAKFNAGASVWRPESIYKPDAQGKGTKNKDMFSNIKAQAWWLLADRFRNTYNAVRNGEKYPVQDMISLSSDLPHLNQLIDELSTPKRDYDANGRVKVESKKDLAKREVASPNLADAIVMAYAPEGGEAAGIFA